MNQPRADEDRKDPNALQACGERTFANERRRMREIQGVGCSDHSFRKYCFAPRAFCVLPVDTTRPRGSERQRGSEAAKRIKIRKSLTTHGLSHCFSNRSTSRSHYRWNGATRALRTRDTFGKESFLVAATKRFILSFLIAAIKGYAKPSKDSN